MNIREVWSEKVVQFYEEDRPTEVLDLFTNELIQEVKVIFQIKDENLYGLTFYFVINKLIEFGRELAKRYVECGKKDYSCFRDFLSAELQEYPHIYKFIEAKTDFQSIDKCANT